jgi:hypothetical protein
MIRILLTISLLIAGVATSVEAALVSRMNGQAYYDTALDITWLADANLQTSNAFGVDGIVATGRMSWVTANKWISAMNAASFLGVSDWRLPTMDKNTDATIVDCATVFETACRDNEYGYLFWQNAVATANPGPFSQVQSAFYWSGTDFAPDPTHAWLINIVNGGLSDSDKGNNHMAWAVRTGDIANAVPLPAAGWMLLTGLLALSGIIRKRLR